jgi:cobalt/nickel transport system permease protein
LRHARVERWSRGNSVLHRRHAAAKILVTLALLVCITTLTHRAVAGCALYLLLLVIGAVTARLPLPAMLLSAAAVLPFVICLAIVSTLAGDPMRAVMLITRGYVSAFAALLLIATTPMPALIGGLEWLHAPPFLLQVMQFLYRYLVVLMEEAGAMRQAAMVRAASLRTLQFRQAAAAAGVLFARSSARAQAIHRAMIARGFEGRIPTFRLVRFRLSDAAFLAATVILVTGFRVLFR